MLSSFLYDWTSEIVFVFYMRWAVIGDAFEGFDVAGESRGFLGGSFLIGGSVIPESNILFRRQAPKLRPLDRERAKEKSADLWYETPGTKRSNQARREG